MNRRILFLVFSVIILSYFSVLSVIPLLEPDEARYAEIPREMLASGDFVTPHLNGVAYLEKPPLFYWGNSLCLWLFGENEFSARFFTTAVSVAGIFLTYWIGAVLIGWRTGLLAAVILSSSLYYYIIGRLNVPDMTLGVLLMVAIFPAYLYLTGRRRSKVYLYVSYAGSALAFLTKGLVGIVFPVAVIFLALCLTRQYRELRHGVSLWGICLFFSMVIPWLFLVQNKNPDFLWFFFIREHFLRYTTSTHGQSQPLWFFLPILIGGFFPWITFLPRIFSSFRGRTQAFLSSEVWIFLLSWALFILIFFSFSGAKLATYACPIFPPLAVLFGRGFDLWIERENLSKGCYLPFIFSALLLAAVVMLNVLAQPASAAQPFASFIPRIRISTSALMPALFPPFAILLLWGIAPLFMSKLGAEKVILLCFILFSLFLVSLHRPAAIFLGSYKSVKELSKVISASAQPGDVVAQYGEYMQGIPFYTKRRTLLVERLGELRYGAERATDRNAYFLGDADFMRLWKSEERVFCVFEHDRMPFINKKFPDPQVVYRSEAGIVIVNRR